MPPPNGVGACLYWPATPGTKCRGVFAQGAAELCQHLGWLALGMRCLARFATKGLPAEHRLEPVEFVLLGKRREAHDVPILLGQHMAREIVPRVTPEAGSRAAGA